MDVGVRVPPGVFSNEYIVEKIEKAEICNYHDAFCEKIMVQKG